MNSVKKVSFLILFILLGGFLLAQPDVSFDIMELPFSRYGSYMAFSAKYDSTSAEYELFLRDVSGKYAWSPDEIFRLDAVVKDKVSPIKSIAAKPWVLEAKGKKSLFKVTYGDAKTVRVKTTAGVALRLTKVKVDPRGWEWYMPIKDNQYRLHGGFDKYVMTNTTGKIDIEIGERVRDRERQPVMLQAIVRPEKNESVELTIERHFVGWKQGDYTKSFDQLVSENKNHFKSFYDKNPSLPSEYEASAALAAYVNWSCVIEPRGIVKREGMLMSKALMRHIWTWDHCFNALSLSYDNPKLAWDQLMVVFDAQQETGALVDYLNDHHTQIAFVKPPIHGLILQRMMERNDYFDSKLGEIYEPLSKWTDYWFEYLDDDNDGIPQYNHGCNSGWDNNTVFDIGFPLEGPDLSAFLVLQMDALSEIASKLGKSDEAKEWKARADKQLSLVVNELWDGKAFIFARSGDGAVYEGNMSSMGYLPMILGERLPQNIRKKMLASIKASGFITDHGIATEHPDSQFYEVDGYWRGPIWAPSTYLITEGIKLCGDPELATTVAERFVKMCDRSGFRENFVATTGEGLRDIGYTWTSSVFLVLGHDYLNMAVK